MADITREDLLKIYRENILPMYILGRSEEGRASDKKNNRLGQELIDIIAGFTWNANAISPSKSTTSYSFSHNIPMCYAIERQQTVNSNIANIINTLKAGTDAGFTMAKVVAKAEPWARQALSSVGEQLHNAYGYIGSINQNSSSNSESSQGKQITGNGEGTGTPLKSPGETATFNDAANSFITGDLSKGIAQTIEAAEAAGAKLAEETKSIIEKGMDEAAVLAEQGKVRAENFGKETAEAAIKNAIKGTEWLNEALKDIGGKVRSIQTAYNELINKWDRKEESNNLNTDLLMPYSFLYFTKVTHKNYVFPLFSATELLNMGNSYSEAGTVELPLIGDLAEPTKQVIGMIAGFTNALNLFQKGAAVTSEQQHLEMAKAFNFNADGQEITSNFVLFNTIKKDAWKKHYRFIVSFMLRNLPFKVSPYSYVPPLLYDIVIPGTKHLPLCYVSDITIQPLGKMRFLSMPDFIKGALNGADSEGTMMVPVPEAWNVSIKFKSLLSNTSNLLLDLKNAPINITMSTVNAQ